jgi:uncharacterized phage infection (PIP) family protein YhgE
MYVKEELSLLTPSTPQPRQRDNSAKLQEQVRVLTVQLQRERKAAQRLEEENKLLEKKHKTEVAQLQSDVEVMKSTLMKAKSTTKSVVAERDRAQGDLKSKTAVLDKLNSQVKSLVSGLVEAVEAAATLNDSELERLVKVLSTRLNSVKESTGADFDFEIKKLSGLVHRGLKPRVNSHVQSIYTSDSFCPDDTPERSYEVEFFTEDSQEYTDKLTPAKTLSLDLSMKSMVFQEPPDDTLHKSSSRDKTLEGKYAIAEHDFAAEQEGDLHLRKGELIQVLTKDDSGWWYGRIGTRAGNFPCNFVHLV